MKVTYLLPKRQDMERDSPCQQNYLWNKKRRRRVQQLKITVAEKYLLIQYLESNNLSPILLLLFFRFSQILL